MDASVRRRRIFIAVIAGLFLLMFLLPWFMEFRHLHGVGRTFSGLARGFVAPFTRYVAGMHIGRGPVKIGIALFTVALLIAGWLIAKRRWQIQWAINGALVLLLVVAFHTESYNETKAFLHGKFIQAWNVYHYYFGSKYFDEMNRNLQYAYTLKADQESAHYLDDVRAVNDLFDYRIKPREVILQYVEGRNDFTPERWEEFKRDLTFFEPFQSKSQWNKMFKDHGYNGTPFWNTIGNFLATHFPLESYRARLFVLGLDQMLLLIAFIVVGLTFGPRWGIVSAIYFLIITLNENYTVAGFIRYDWYCATVIGFCLFHKGWYKASAPFLAYATMTRIFPVFLLLGPGLLWVIDWIKTRKMDRKLPVMFVVYGLCCLFFFYMGTWNRRGWAVWSDYYRDIGFHTEQHYLGPKRIGLKHIFIDDLATPRMVKGDNKERSFSRQEWLYHTMRVALFALFLAALARRNRSDAFLLGYMFVFTILVLSRYYWALIGMFFLLSAEDRSRWRNILANVFLLAQVPLYYTFVVQEKEPYAYYMPLSYLFFGFFVFLAGSFLIEDYPYWKGQFDVWRARRAAPATAVETTGGDARPS